MCIYSFFLHCALEMLKYQIKNLYPKEITCEVKGLPRILDLSVSEQAWKTNRKCESCSEWWMDQLFCKKMKSKIGIRKKIILQCVFFIVHLFRWTTRTVSQCICNLSLMYRLCLASPPPEIPILMCRTWWNCEVSQCVQSGRDTFKEEKAEELLGRQLDISRL